MGNEWVEILITYDPLEAEMIKDLLESGGIPVVLRSSKVSPYPVNIGKIGEIKVLVNKEDQEAAEEVIKGSEDTPTPDI
jgi:Putative prokaryotic signal transducing protein